MEKLRILSAAAALESFTTDLLARLSGEDQGSVVRLVDSLLERSQIVARRPSRGSTGNAGTEYRWTADGRTAARIEVGSARMQSPPVVRQSPGVEMEPYEDPFTTALEIARGWIEEAETSSDEKTLDRHLSMARAEVHTLRRFLNGEPASSVEDIEELTRRIERLSTRPPIEAFRTRIRRSVLEAIRNAARHVPLKSVQGEATSTDPDMAFVFNATGTASETAREVEQTVEQIGAACVIFQMAGVSPRSRKLAFEALRPFFTGPGSVRTKVFIIIDSGPGSRSRTVLSEFVRFFGSADQLTGASNASGDPEGGDDWSFEPSMLLSSISTPPDDWLPRGLLKHYLLQSYINKTMASQDLARVTLNDPVVFDCVAAGLARTRHRPSQFSYHRVELDLEHAAVIRGLVRGSFAGTGTHSCAYEVQSDVRLLSSAG